MASTDSASTSRSNGMWILTVLFSVLWTCLASPTFGADEAPPKAKTPRPAEQTPPPPSTSPTLKFGSTLPDTIEPDPDTPKDPNAPSIFDELKGLTVLPVDSAGWDKWDDWAMFSRETGRGFSMSVSPGLGAFETTAVPTTPGGGKVSTTKFMVHIPVRGYYGFPEFPWLQFGPSFSTGVSTFNAVGERQYIVPMMFGVGFQVRFVRFPPLAPLFVGGGLPFGWTYISGGQGAKSFYFAYGWEICAGLELAVSPQHSVGFRFTFTEETVNSGGLRSFNRYQIGFDYRFYFKGKLFNDT